MFIRQQTQHLKRRRFTLRGARREERLAARPLRDAQRPEGAPPPGAGRAAAHVQLVAAARGVGPRRAPRRRGFGGGDVEGQQRGGGLVFSGSEAEREAKKRKREARAKKDGSGSGAPGARAGASH